MNEVVATYQVDEPGPGGYRDPEADTSRAMRAVDPLDELLRAVSEVLDLRRVFATVSHIANQLVPHDSLELVVHNQSGHVTLRARAPEGPGTSEDVRSGADKSSLCVCSHAGQHVVRLTFGAKRAEAYTVDDEPTARRIAACLAVAVSHEELAKAEREREAIRIRAEYIESRPRPVAGKPEQIRGFPRAVGESAAWRKVLAQATQVAATETTAFLHGESGTGKEVLARYIHGASPRKRGPFVAINCAALPEQLLESEMFGHERGAFTGAHQAKPGQIELASTGVLFLDEVSEMSLAAQAKLLRFLQEREFQRVGGIRLVKANVRVIAASNRDLREAVQSGRFRGDLYYRLQVFDIAIPPLRERRSDIPLLAEAFLRNLTLSPGASRQLTDAALARLLSHSWPGNVRELQNALERAAILSEGGPIGPEHFALHADIAAVAPQTNLAAAARQTVERVLRETDWNKSKAARLLGLTRTQLYGRLRKYGLEEQCSAARYCHGAF
jgi:transcriptional regulator with GAF, ATPase, and Fis domain